MYCEIYVNVEYVHKNAMMSHVTKRETDDGRKSGYYAAILSGKSGRGL